MSTQHLNSGAPSSSSSMILEEPEVHKYRSKSRRRLDGVPQGQPTSSNTNGSSNGGSVEHGNDGGNFNGGDGSGGNRHSFSGSKWSGSGGQGRGGGGGGSWSNKPGEECSMCNIRNNDPRVHYSPHWMLETHSTVVDGSTVSLKFNGSTIVVFGTVPASDQLEPPTAAYVIDTLAPTPMTALPHGITAVPNQPLYTSPLLSSNGEHQLLINVTKTQAPYTLAGFFVPPIEQPKSTSSQSSQHTSSTEFPVSTSSMTMPNSSPKTISIVAGVLGSLVFLFMVGAIIFLILRRRKHARREPCDRMCSESSRSRPETVYSAFTTSESILRNDPSIWDRNYYYSPSYISCSDGSSQLSWPSGSSRASEVRASPIAFARPVP